MKYINVIIFIINFLITTSYLILNDYFIYFLLFLLLINYYLWKIKRIILCCYKIKLFILKELKLTKIVNLNFIFEVISKSKRYYFEFNSN